MTTYKTLRIFTNGGILSPEELRKIIQAARQSGCNGILPGFRQELYLQVEENGLATAEKALDSHAIPYAKVEDKAENIVTSFAALHILPTTAWLLGDTYLDILDSFTYQPKLKINIVDPLQNLVPLFTGELNFIASAYPRYWYLYVHLSRFGKRQVWPVLIDGDDIGNLSRLLEAVYVEKHPDTIQDLFLAVSQQFTGRSRHWEEELHLPVHSFPVIEGMHSTGNAHWLGIYRRNQSFSPDFLEALYAVCIQSKIGKICITPHKTLLIQDIRWENLHQWEKLLGMHRIATQHSALEMNWQLPDLDDEAIKLKNTWIRELEEKEAYTAGLSFALETSPMQVATSVLIKQKPATTASEADAVYDILHASDFSIHPLHWQVFAGNVSAQKVASTLIDLCLVYYTRLGATSTVTLPDETPVFTLSHQVYQCPDCLTVYDPVYGDATSDVRAGLSFEELPESYTCSLCDTPKASFVSVEIGDSTFNYSRDTRK